MNVSIYLSIYLSKLVSFTNRNSVGFRLVSKSVTLTDLEPRNSNGRDVRDLYGSWASIYLTQRICKLTLIGFFVDTCTWNSR